MGLLDQFSGMSEDQTQGLLAAAAKMLQQSGPSTRPVGLGQILGDSYLTYADTTAAAKRRKLEEDQFKQVGQLRGLQIQEAQGGLADHERARQQANELRQFYIQQRLGSAPTAGPAAGAGQQPPPLGPTPMQSMPGAMPAAPGAPQAQAGQAGQGDPFSQRMALAQQLRNAGFHEQADAQEAAALKFKPKFDNTPHVVMGPGGKPMLVQTADDGTVRPISGGYGVAEKLNFQDLGGSVAGIDPYTGKPSAKFDKTATPDGIANRAQAERHFQSEQVAPQYMDTQDGIMALPKRLAPGASPVGQVVMGPDGNPLAKKQSIPQYVIQGINGNAKSLASIDAALASLSTPAGQDAVGLKGRLPDMLLNRLYPGGTETRANIADVGSLILHDRSGAAVTAAESPRLMPFIPLATDDAATAKKKLARFKQIFEAETNNLTFAFPQAKKLAEQAAQNGRPAGGAQPGSSTIPAAAVAMLRGNPGMRQHFDEKYGPGAADSVLGK